VKSATIDWDPVAERFVSEGTIRGRRVEINAPKVLPEGEGRHGPSGYSASELLLAAAGSCAAWDVIEIARKQRQDVTALSVVVDGEQHADPPWAFHTIPLRFTVRGHGLEPDKLRRAIELVVERYCSVIATVRGVAAVSTEVDVLEDADIEEHPEVPVDVSLGVLVDGSPDALGS
jgi:putative redox protein